MNRDRVLRVVHQYLVENNYGVAALALEEDVQFDKDSTMPSGELLRLLDEHAELTANRKVEATEDLSQLEQKGDGRYCNTLALELSKVHAGSIVSVDACGPDAVVTGAADKTIRLTKVEHLVDGFPALAISDSGDSSHSSGGSHHSAMMSASAPVLSVRCHPVHPHIVASSDMAGGVTVSNSAKSGETLFQAHNHKKYVVHVRWSPGGRFLASACYDHTVCVWDTAVTDNGQTFTAKLIHTLSFKGAVESIAFRPSNAAGAGAKADGDGCGKQEMEAGAVLVVAVREDNRLHFVSLPDGAQSDLNMNMLGDDFVSFSALHVSYSPCGRFVLASSDRDRLLLFSTESRKLVRTFYGASSDIYSQPKHCWHPSGLYIYATNQDNSILVWEVASQRVVERLTGHTGTVRDLILAGSDVLISCSFDKTVRIWKDVPVA
eukprot:m.61621 g.61621  ORF g.61621 m.61621 type:complete len:434 (+) comp13733_c0_seq2:232-1533(+)